MDGEATLATGKLFAHVRCHLLRPHLSQPGLACCLVGSGPAAMLLVVVRADTRTLVHTSALGGRKASAQTFQHGPGMSTVKSADSVPK